MATPTSISNISSNQQQQPYGGGYAQQGFNQQGFSNQYAQQGFNGLPARPAASVQVSFLIVRLSLLLLLLLLPPTLLHESL